MTSTDNLPCRPCPVEECPERFLSAEAAGRHLDRYHGEAGRWAARRAEVVR